MRTFLTIILGFAFVSCMMPPPELPKQQLPRQELPAQEPARSDLQTKQSALTPGMVVTRIQKGKTTQTEIMETFGPPDMVTKSGSVETWGYDKVSREVAVAATGAQVSASAGAASASGSSLSAGGGGLVGGGGGGVLGGVVGLLGGSMGQAAAQNQQQSSQQAQQQARRTETTTTVFLLVYFSDKGVVTDYKLSATKF